MTATVTAARAAVEGDAGGPRPLAPVEGDGGREEGITARQAQAAAAMIGIESSPGGRPLARRAAR